MFQRKPRRFRRHSNGRNYQSRGNGSERTGIGSASFTNIRGRNNFKPHQSAEKLAEKYKLLAKEALSSGDKTLSESYFQHADHYMRVVNEKSLHQNRVQVSEKQETNNQTIDSNNSVNQDETPETKKEEKK